MWSQDLHSSDLTLEDNLNHLQYTASNTVTVYDVTESFSGVQTGLNHHMWPQKSPGTGHRSYIGRTIRRSVWSPPLDMRAWQQFISCKCGNKCTMKKFSVTNSNNNWIRYLLSADFNKTAMLTSRSSEQNCFAEIKWHRMTLALKVTCWQSFG